MPYVSGQATQKNAVTTGEKGNRAMTRITARFLDIGSIDYEADCDGDREWPISVGVYPESTATSILSEITWEVDQSDIPDDLTNAALLEALRPEAVRAVHCAAFMTAGQELLAWFRIEWAS
jgi:hypothetical protein